ncbi:MAG: Mur ligase family protein, partial [Planctomycetota bacterium]
MSMRLDGARVTVMGLGRFGGGLGAVRWLAEQGAHVLLSDRAPADRLQQSVQLLEDLVERGVVELELGGHDRSSFVECDLLVVNPAVPHPWDNPLLDAARAAGVPLTTEMRLLVERLDASRVIGVTGSAGKSTTAAMIHHVLERCGARSHLGGNVGGSLLGDLPRIDRADWVVLELSSAMLCWLGPGVGTSTATGWSPHVAVITNIAPNHLDWHGSFEHYVRSKRMIAAHQTPRDHLIYAADAPGASTV